MQQDCDQWKYVSLVDISGDTYDFSFQTKKDASDFIVAISSTAATFNKNFTGITNKTMINVFMFREKLQRMAKLRKTHVIGLFMRAVYLTAAQRLPEFTFYEKKAKY